VAPHLSIYKPQITWIASSLHRITGSVLSGGFYIFGFGYLVAPLFGMHWESHAIAAAVGSLPLIAKMGLKFSLAMPFTFHCINGVRHLVWDTGAQMTKKQVVWTGWTVVAATVLSSAALVAM
jgi:succinate dehydrogenase (ubiquinone) cytochrome b560 subunit